MPTPLVDTSNSPGRCLASANRSSRLRIWLLAGTTMPKVTPLIWMMGVVSRIGSHSSFCTSGARNTGCGICAMV